MMLLLSSSATAEGDTASVTIGSGALRSRLIGMAKSLLALLISACPE